MIALVALAAAPVVIALYAYVGYPLALLAITTLRPKQRTAVPSAPLPDVTITVPVYNAVGTIRATLESLLGLDYPRDRLQLIVVSDASTDRTDEIAAELADRVLRLPVRQGKTAAENAAMGAARGEIIVNVDAGISLPPHSLMALIRAFDDPSVGVASGRDVSVGAVANEATTTESGYVGYEMWLRGLETSVGSIVGASGCFYGFRRCIHERPLSPALSWDFASALVAREMGYRSVSVSDAVCYVSRTSGIRTELKRKVRTMARGLNTLFEHRALMNPVRYGAFALMLVSHKLLRWVPYLFAPIAILALGVLAMESAAARVALALIALGGLTGLYAIRSRRSMPPKPVAVVGFLVASVIAGLLAWVKALRRTEVSTWTPTIRPGASTV